MIKEIAPRESLVKYEPPVEGGGEGKSPMSDDKFPGTIILRILNIFI